MQSTEKTFEPLPGADEDGNSTSSETSGKKSRTRRLQQLFDGSIIIILAGIIYIGTGVLHSDAAFIFRAVGFVIGIIIVVIGISTTMIIRAIEIAHSDAD